MKLRVQYMAQLRTAIGCSEEERELSDGASLAELLSQLAASHGADAGKHLFTAAGLVQPSLMIAVNGTAAPTRNVAEIALRCGDVVTLMPPIAGG